MSSKSLVRVQSSLLWRRPAAGWPRSNRSALVAAGIVAAALLTAGGPPAQAKRVKMRVALANPLLTNQERQTTFLKVGLTAEAPAEVRRVPVNVTLVLDKSGSMAGEKIERAKQAARMALDRLHPEDIVSVVAYDDSVTVLVPATRAGDRRAVLAGIEQLEAGGQTALFAGVSKGAQELRKFHDRQRINRLVLLSDGQANVGPSTPAELGALGASLGKEGIGVTTIGLGLDYNEDLMTQLALRSEGNHFFARTAEELSRGFDLEFSIGLAVPVQQVKVRIRCAEGVRPQRLLNARGELLGQTAQVDLNQLYGGREASLLLELQVPGAAAGTLREVAQVEVSYTDLQTRQTESMQQAVMVQFTDAAKKVEQAIDGNVMEEVALHEANRQYKVALELRDRGQVEQARQLLLDNKANLAKQGSKYRSQRLQDFGEMNRLSSDNLDEGRWNEERKRMRDIQLEFDVPSAAY
ncbi:MAG: VWA domain-containing protein [Deltaproteobacteria bacterium]|nr:VWA domain-containing protein [Deltaproteobacteria bacterium]